MRYAGRFSGRTAVVTGGASGLGKAAAARIVAEGGKVVLWDLNADALTAAAEEIGAAHVIALDVADPEAVAAAAQDSAQALDGRIDILVASAASTSWSPRPASPAPPCRCMSFPSTTGSASSISI